MRIRVLVLLLASPLLSVLPAAVIAPAAAADPIAAAVQTFASGEHVYVDSSAEEAGNVDAGAVRDKIRSTGSPIYVAVLPDSASTAPEDVSGRIGTALGGRVTVAVLVGKHFRAASSALPAGVAASLATQAFNEGKPDVTKVLTTFVAKAAAKADPRSNGVGRGTKTGGAGGVLVAFLVILLVLAGLAALAVGLVIRRGRRGRVDAVRAEARRWYERLGGEVFNLGAGDNDAARQALADASERYNAAGSQLSRSASEPDYRAARDTALEGLHYVRAARTSLGIDPGPELPPTSVQEAAGRIQRDHVGEIGGQQIQMRPAYAEDAPYYYPGGMVGGGRVPGGWYSQPFWKTALVGGAAGLGGFLVADALFDAVRGPFYGGWGGGGMFGGGMYGGGWGGGGYDAGYNQGFDSGYDQGSDPGYDGGGGDFGGGG
ncbi:MAG: hypothetical protein ABJA34_13440, partial [Pseudonocardiales bacterium]